MEFKPILYEHGEIILIDQTKLPAKKEMMTCRTVDELWQAIKQLSVRGAPLLGVAAAYGICLALDTTEIRSFEELERVVSESAQYIGSARPTAVNLFWALDKMKHMVAKSKDQDVEETIELIHKEAKNIYEEDLALSRKIGEHGNTIIENGDGILTHCNAGGLATSGYGTALAVFFTAHERGKKIHVYADETRPLLQGARLTTWELKEYGIDVTLLCDNMAAVLMREGKIQKIITGADRIAANGDSANKIGTYGVAVIAKYHNIPFYIAAPYSTFDFSLSTGKEIVIEQRDKKEVTHWGNVQTAPDGIDVFNPAFDVTPAELIAGIITEKGIIEKPDLDKIRTLYSE